MAEENGLFLDVIRCLPESEQEEYARLKGRGRLATEGRGRLATVRRKELRDKAHQLYGERRGPYDAYIAWMRLTHNGRRSREEMPPRSQAEYDSYGFKERREAPISLADQAEAKRFYEAVTGQ